MRGWPYKRGRGEKWKGSAGGSGLCLMMEEEEELHIPSSEQLYPNFREKLLTWFCWVYSLPFNLILSFCWLLNYVVMTPNLIKHSFKHTHTLANKQMYVQFGRKHLFKVTAVLCFWYSSCSQWTLPCVEIYFYPLSVCPVLANPLSWHLHSSWEHPTDCWSLTSSCMTRVPSLAVVLAIQTTGHTSLFYTLG